MEEWFVTYNETNQGERPVLYKSVEFIDGIVIDITSLNKND